MRRGLNEGSATRHDLKHICGRESNAPKCVAGSCIALDYDARSQKIWMAADRGCDLDVTDGRGEPYVLNVPFRLTAAGWVSSLKRAPLAVTPLQWKPYPPRKR